MAKKATQKRNPAKADKDGLARFDAMSDSVQGAFKKLYRIEGEHAKAYQKGLFAQRSCADIDVEIKKLKKDLCVDVGGDWKDIKPWYDIYSREQDAKNEMDEDDANRVLDTHRIMYRSLGRGEMVNFIDILENPNYLPGVITASAEDKAANAAQEAAEAGAE